MPKMIKATAADVRKRIAANSQPLIDAIDRYIAKDDANLATELDDAGYVEATETVAEISVLEELIASLLKEDTNIVIEALKSSDDLLDFAENYWQSIKMDSDLGEKIAAVFRDGLLKDVKTLTAKYIAETDPELAEASVTKSIGSEVTHIEITQRTTAWVESWSEELGSIMQLSSHDQIEKLLSTSLEQGHSVAQFTQALMDSGIRDEYFRARRVAQTEMLTAHSAAQQEAFIQSPSVEKKMWRHTGGHRNEPRPNHVAINGQQVNADEPFELLGADGGIYHPMFPRDPSELPAGERINCKCIMQPVVSDSVLGMTLEERQELRQKLIEEDDGAWELELDARNKARVRIGDGQADSDGGIIDITRPLLSRKEEVARLKEVLGINNVNVRGLPAEVLNGISNELETMFEEFPQLQGVIQKVEVVSGANAGTAQFVVGNKKGNISTSLRLNSFDLMDMRSVNDIINENVTKQYWTQKSGVRGIVRHEMTHALELVQAFAEQGVDMFGTDLNGTLDRVVAFQAYKNSTVSSRVVKQALSNLGMKSSDWLDISKYVAEQARDAGINEAFAEALAEAISDESEAALSAEILRIARGGF